MACNLEVFTNMATYLVILGGFNNLNLPPCPAILWYFHTLPHFGGFNNLRVPPLLAILWYFQTLQNIGWLPWLTFFVGIFKHCQIFGVFNKFKVPPLLTILWTALVRYFQALPRCHIFGGFNKLKFLPWPAIIATYLLILGGFNNLKFPPWPAILWHFQAFRHIWWLQWLKSAGCGKSCCVFKPCKILGPWPAILWYFQTLPCWWL